MNIAAAKPLAATQLRAGIVFAMERGPMGGVVSLRDESSVDLVDVQRRLAEIYLKLSVRAIGGSKTRGPDPAKAMKYAERAAKYLRWSLR